MKVNLEIDCSPEEARRFLGLPDVAKANDVYIEALIKTMKGEGSLDQLGNYVKQMAPMGEIGMKFFQQLVQQGAGAAMTGFASGSGFKSGGASKGERPDD